jgi:hypothetical protein
MSWHERCDIRFSDDRLRDFAARLVLRHSSRPGLVKALGVGGVEHLEDLYKTVHSRPFAGLDSRWFSLAQAEGNADSDWKSWATAAYPEAYQTVSTPPSKPVQLSLF